MCIIVACERGVALPSKETLKQCFNRNNDGAGIMYEYNGGVNILKGYMDFNKFYKTLMRINKNVNLTEHACVLHFRISTGGNVDGGNCHPYPISADENILRQLMLKNLPVGIAHNGIINMYSSSSYYYKDPINAPKEVLNDTQKFIQKCVAPIYNLDKEFYKHEDILALLEEIAESKLCFLTKEGDILYIGDFIEDDGVKYSNSTYIPYNLHNSYSKGYSYNYDWDSLVDYGEYGFTPEVTILERNIDDVEPFKDDVFTGKIFTEDGFYGTLAQLELIDKPVYLTFYDDDYNSHECSIGKEECKGSNKIFYGVDQQDTLFRINANKYMIEPIGLYTTVEEN